MSDARQESTATPRGGFFAELHRLLLTWDDSADTLGPEWTAFAERVEAVRAALPRHEADHAVLLREVARFTNNA